MHTHGRVYPSGLMSALVIGRRALGPIDVPCAVVERESVKKTKGSRSSMMDEDSTVSEQRDTQL